MRRYVIYPILKRACIHLDDDNINNNSIDAGPFAAQSCTISDGEDACI
jgi:hypothetical protein